MLIWLPPSEGKTAPQAGPSLCLESLVLPELTEARSEVVEALTRASRSPDAAKILKLGAKGQSQISTNANLWQSPCAPASALYTGVLYDAVDFPTLSVHALAKAEETVWIFSGLWGTLRPTDLIPDHRLAIGVNLKPLGSLARWWRQHLSAAIGDSLAESTIVDFRSSTYQGAYPGVEAHRITLEVWQDGPDGPRRVTHWMKHWRGLVTRYLLSHPQVNGESSLTEVTSALLDLASEDRVKKVNLGETHPTGHGGSLTEVQLIVSPPR